MAVCLKNVHTLRKYLWKGEDNIFLFAVLSSTIRKPVEQAGLQPSRVISLLLQPASRTCMEAGGVSVLLGSQNGNMRIIFRTFSLKSDVL